MELWRIVIAKVATWEELNGPMWSMDDAARMNAVLDMRAAIEEALMPTPPKETK